MLTMGGITQKNAMSLVLWAGILETALSLSCLIFWRSRGLLWLTIGLMVSALGGVAWTAPLYLTGAFNPVTLNLSMILLAVIALLGAPDVPNAAFCLRAPKESL